MENYKEYKDYSKEYINISYCILYKKGWYAPKKGSLMSDLKYMLGMDGYVGEAMSDSDVFRIIVRAWQQYCEWRASINHPIYDPIMKIVSGTYFNIYYDKPWYENVILSILGEMSFIEKKYLALPLPHYDKTTPKSATWEPGMTYKELNRRAEEVWNYKPEDLTVI